MAKTDMAATDLTIYFNTHKASEGWKYRACGVGVIGNKGERAKGIVCTDVMRVEAADCKESFPSSDGTYAAYTPPADQFCFLWPNIDSNICVGKKRNHSIFKYFQLTFLSKQAILVDLSMLTNMIQRIQKKSMWQLKKLCAP
jgi:hypothetical protein